MFHLMAELHAGLEIISRNWNSIPYPNCFSPSTLR